MPINVVQSAEYWFCDDASSRSRRNVCSSPRSARRSLANGTMRTMMIIVGYITGDSSTESSFVEHEQVVEALGSCRLHPAFGNGVCYRASKRGANLLNAEAL